MQGRAVRHKQYPLESTGYTVLHGILGWKDHIGYTRSKRTWDGYDCRKSYSGDMVSWNVNWQVSLVLTTSDLSPLIRAYRDVTH